MSDIDTRIAEIRARREKYADIAQEGVRQKLKYLNNAGEQAVDYVNDAKAAGRLLTEEIKELETFAHGLLLSLALLKHQASGEANQQPGKE